MTLGQNKISDLQNSIDWALKGNGAKYGNIDTTKIAAGGESCGGTEALSVSYHNDLVKLTFLVNSGALNPQSRCLVEGIEIPRRLLQRRSKRHCLQKCKFPIRRATVSNSLGCGGL